MMPRADRFPSHYDMCLRCREAGLENVADFIHEIVFKLNKYEIALEKIVRSQYNADSKDIANTALETKRPHDNDP